MGWKTLEAQPKRGVQSGVYAGKRKEIGAEAERCNPLSGLRRNETRETSKKETVAEGLLFHRNNKPPSPSVKGPNAKRLPFLFPFRRVINLPGSGSCQHSKAPLPNQSI